MESALIYRSGIFPWTCLPDISPLYVDWSSPLSRFHPHRACLPVFFTWQNCFHIILLPIFTPRKNVPTTVQLMDHRRQKIKVNIDARQRVLFKQFFSSDRNNENIDRWNRFPERVCACDKRRQDRRYLVQHENALYESKSTAWLTLVSPSINLPKLRSLPQSPSTATD